MTASRMSEPERVVLECPKVATIESLCASEEFSMGRDFMGSW
jgi:hypothetical protein